MKSIFLNVAAIGTSQEILPSINDFVEHLPLWGEIIHAVKDAR